MADDKTYWDKFWDKKLSRRRLLSTTALAGGGLAAAAVVGCSSDSSTEPTGTGGTGEPGAGTGPGADFLKIEYQNLESFHRQILVS